jgi:hypothetical protein
MNFKHIQATRNLMYRALKVLKSSLTAVYSLLISTFLVLS